MLRLAAVMYILVATVLGGGAVITVLSLGLVTRAYIGGAFAAGLLLALPLAAVLGSKLNAALKR